MAHVITYRYFTIKTKKMQGRDGKMGNALEILLIAAAALFLIICIVAALLDDPAGWRRKGK